MAAAYSHIARFAAAYPCLNRGADFRYLTKRLANEPRFMLRGFAMRVVKGRKACLMAGVEDHAIAPARLGISASIQA